MENSVIPKFHIGAYIYSSGQTTIEEIYTMIINISTLADNNFISESAEKYANWIKKNLDEKFFALVKSGCSLEEISEKLMCSQNVVKTNIKIFMAKLLVGLYPNLKEMH